MQIRANLPHLVDARKQPSGQSMLRLTFPTTGTEVKIPVTIVKVAPTGLAVPRGPHPVIPGEGHCHIRYRRRPGPNWAGGGTGEGLALAATKGRA